MKKVYNIERQYIYNSDNRSLVDHLYDFDDLLLAVEALNHLTIEYLDDKNVAIEVVEYELDENNEYNYVGVEAGFYGINAANSLGLDIEYMKKEEATMKLLTRDQNDEIYQIDLNLFKNRR